MKYILKTVLICLYLPLVLSCGGSNDDNNENTKTYYQQIIIPSSGGTVVIELKDDHSGRFFSSEVNVVNGETDWLKVAKTNDGKIQSKSGSSGNGMPTITIESQENWQSQTRSASLLLYHSLGGSTQLNVTQEAGSGSSRDNYTDEVQNIVSTDAAW